MGFRFIGSHNDELEGGQPIEPGQFIIGDLDLELPKHKHLQDDGYLIEVEDIPHDDDLPEGHPKSIEWIDPRQQNEEEAEPTPLSAVSADDPNHEEGDG